MAIYGTAYVHIRADDKYFESDVRKATAKIKNVTIQLKADVDMAKASKKIRDLRYRITSKDAVLKVDANVAKAEEKMAKLLAKFTNKDVVFNAKANTSEANTALNELSARYAQKRVPFTAQADTRAADRALAALSRARTTTFNAHIDPATQRALTGLFNTITGTISAEKIKGTLVGLAANFEGLAVKATMAVTAITALSGVALVAGGNLLSLGGDLTEVIGVAGLFPAAMFAITTTVRATTMAWKGFGDALNTEDPKKAAEALAKLPPEAQKAVVALRKFKGEIQKPVQKAFWENMGTSLQDMYEKKVPEFAKGMSLIGGAMGRFTRQALESVTGLDSFDETFINIEKTIDNLTKGLNPAITALKSWIDVGATYLPSFGTWVSDLATKFGEWSKKAEETGQMNIWIETGIQRVQELGSMIKSTTGIFSGLTTAARAAGAPGMTELAASLREIRDTVNGEPFQSRLIIVLEGARSGVEKLGEGFGNLMDYVGESSVALGIFLDLAGEIGGLTFNSIRTLFDGTGLGTGLHAAMQGLKDLMVIMEPGFEDLGASMGILGHIAGEVLRNLGPGLNQLFETVRGILERVQEGVIKVIPIFNEFIQSVLATVQGPLYALAEIVGNLLEGFAGLPGPIQTVIMSIGLFALAFSKVFGAIDGFKDKLTKTMADADSRVGRNLRNIQSGAQIMNGAFTRETQQMRDNGIRSFNGFGTSVRDTMAATAHGVRLNMGAAFEALPPRAQRAVSGINRAFTDIGQGFKAGLSLDRELGGVRQGFANLPASARESASRIGESFKSTFAKFGDFVAPAGSAVRNLASEMHGNLAPARLAFDNLATHARTATLNAASQVSTGLKSIGSGISGFFGGPVGIALMALTVLYGEYATQQAKAKGQVDSFASAFEASSGRIDSGVRKVIQSNLDMKESFFGLEFDSGFDIAKKIGVPLKDVVDAAAGVPGAMDRVQTSLGQTGNAATKYGFAVEGVLEVWKKTAGPMRGIAEFIDKTGLFRSEGDKLNEQIMEQNRLMEEQQRAHQQTADSLGIGTVAAARMAENYDVLRDAASSVSSRVEALKDNIDIQNNSMLASRNAARDHAKSMFDLDEAMKKLPGAGENVIDVNGRMADSFRTTLTDADGTFNNLTQQSIAFSEEMDAAATSILNVGMSEMKKLQDAGASLPEAQAGAMAKMNEQTEVLRSKLSTLGFDAGQQQVILNQLGLNPDKLMGALVVDTKAAEADMMRFEVMKGAIINGNWSVALAASSDAVKEELLKTKEYKDAFEKDGWKGVIDIVNNAGPGIEEFMLDIAEIKDGDKAKINAAIDAEFPGRKVIQEATSMLDGYKDITIPSKKLLALDDASAPAAIARGEVKMWNDMNPLEKAMVAIDNATPAASTAKGSIEGYNFLEAAQKDLKANNLTGPGVIQAQATMETLRGVERELEAQNAAGKGTAESQATMNSLKDVIRKLEASNDAGAGLRAAQGTIDTLKGKTATLSAEDKASAIVDAVNGKALANKTFSISALWDGVSQNVRSFFGLYNGGIISGAGVQTFANGGIQMPNMKQYANGGVENHVAQIARGAWPVRVWAEPETGGEAYVPLHPSKRKRSLQILDEVAEMFGYSLVKSVNFANGGIVKMSSKTPSMVSNSSSVTTQAITSSVANTNGPTIVTHVHPSAGLNEKQVADSVSENIYWKLSTLG